MLRPEAWEGVKAAGNNYDYYGLRIMAVTIKLKDAKGKDVVIRLITAYAPHSGCSNEEEYHYANDLAIAIDSCGENEVLIIGSDTNASLSRLTMDQCRRMMQEQ